MSPAALNFKPSLKHEAHAAGLRYVTDDMPGIRRRPQGMGWVYLDPAGRRIRNQRTLARIRSLALPPAWEDVWICPIENGHIQATGRDARGRKQYRYHARWQEVRTQTKFHRMLRFGRLLPRIRRRLHRDLARPGLPREKVLAAVIMLLEKTLIRVGNDEYAAANDSFGLTTLRDRHASVSGGSVHFRFRGKSGKAHEVRLSDRRLARIVQQCQDLPGQELLQYVDERGAVCDIGSSDVNDYLREITGEELTAKDFRTWAGTVLFVDTLRDMQPCRTPTQAKRQLSHLIQHVAAQLRNTPTICRNYYIHPFAIESYLDNSIHALVDEICAVESGNGRRGASRNGRAGSGKGSLSSETVTMRLLERAVRRKRAMMAREGDGKVRR